MTVLKKMYFCRKFHTVKVDSNPIVENRLYAFWFDGDSGNIYDVTMEQLYNREWLWNFFNEHKQDLGYYRVSDISEAIERTIDDLDLIDDLFLDETMDLDTLFRNLSQNWADDFFQRSKGNVSYLPQARRNSWVRFYAIKIDDGIYVLTGGTIKLTEKMQDREHTRLEVNRLERCRDYLVGQGICDFHGFYEFLNE